MYLQLPELTLRYNQRTDTWDAKGVRGASAHMVDGLNRIWSGIRSSGPQEPNPVVERAQRFAEAIGGELVDIASVKPRSKPGAVY